jgi:hypothetical protein
MPVEGLAVYSLENAKAALEAQAKRTSIPWAMVKPKFLEFVEHLRGTGIFVCEAMDSATAEAAQEVLFVDAKSIALGIEDGIVVLHRAAAGALLESHGSTKFGIQWMLVKGVVENFLKDLYSHNVFLMAAQPKAAKLVQEKTSSQNIYLRLRSLETTGGQDS